MVKWYLIVVDLGLGFYKSLKSQIFLSQKKSREVSEGFKSSQQYEVSLIRFMYMSNLSSKFLNFKGQDPCLHTLFFIYKHTCGRLIFVKIRANIQEVVLYFVCLMYEEYLRSYIQQMQKKMEPRPSLKIRRNL